MHVWVDKRRKREWEDTCEGEKQIKAFVRSTDAYFHSLKTRIPCWGIPSNLFIKIGVLLRRSFLADHRVDYLDGQRSLWRRLPNGIFGADHKPKMECANHFLFWMYIALYEYWERTVLRKEQNVRHICHLTFQIHYGERANRAICKVFSHKYTGLFSYLLT